MESSSDFPLVIKKSVLNRNRRLVRKNGDLNIHLKNIPCKEINYVKDFANTLVSLRWRWVLVFVFVSNAFFYVSFAGFWMLDAWLSGDFNTTKPVQDLCIKNARSFAGYLLLSIESITTTGYGYLYPNDDHCQLAWIILTLNTIVMIFIDGAFISVVFLKISRPLKRHTVNMFSKHAVVCLRNGKLCLTSRIYDYTKKHDLNPRLSMFVINKNTLDVVIEEIKANEIGLLLWPTDIVHEINSKSPLWKLTASDLMNSKFELVVTLSGSSSVTGQFTASQTSYLPHEISWGYRFKNCMEFEKKIQKHVVVERDVFNMTPCDSPLCSAFDLEKIKNEIDV